MLIILKQVFILYIFMFLGWFLGKRGKLLSTHTPILANLMLNVFFPCKIFLSFSKNFSIHFLASKWKMLLCSVLLLLTLHFLSLFLAKFLGKTSYETKVYEYSITISNYAYMGYALIENIFGSEVLANMIFFCIPFSIYTYTVGYLKLTRSKISIKRVFNPMTIAILLGMFFGLLGLTLPDFINQILVSSSSCAGPVSMLMAGVVLSSFAMRDLFGKGRDYIIIALRLILIPAVVFIVYKFSGSSHMLLPAMFITMMPTGLGPIIFAQSTNQPPEIGARLAFISHLISCLTLPLWLSLI